MNRTLAALVLAGVCLSGCGNDGNEIAERPASARQWITFASQRGKFSLQMPSEPKLFNRTIAEPHGPTTYEYAECVDSNLTVWVRWGDIDEKIAPRWVVLHEWTLCSVAAEVEANVDSLSEVRIAGHAGAAMGATRLNGNKIRAESVRIGRRLLFIYVEVSKNGTRELNKAPSSLAFEDELHSQASAMTVPTIEKKYTLTVLGSREWKVSSEVSVSLAFSPISGKSKEKPFVGVLKSVLPEGISIDNLGKISGSPRSSRGVAFLACRPDFSLKRGADEVHIVWFRVVP